MLGDHEGFATLSKVLKDDEAGFARQQASDLFEAKSGKRFSYDADRSVAQNAEALKKMDEWYTREGSRLKLNPATGKFE